MCKFSRTNPMTNPSKTKSYNCIFYEKKHKQQHLILYAEKNDKIDVKNKVDIILRNKWADNKECPSTNLLYYITLNVELPERCIYSGRRMIVSVHKETQFLPHIVEPTYLYDYALLPFISSFVDVFVSKIKVLLPSLGIQFS